MRHPILPFLFAASLIASSPLCATVPTDTLTVNDQGYLEMQGLNVMLAKDLYPEGHQSGVTIIQNGARVAANGYVGFHQRSQWSSFPKVDAPVADKELGELSVTMHYPDPTRATGFNPVTNPDLKLDYTVRVKAEGSAFRIIVDLAEPIPAQWEGSVDFSIEFFPGALLGRTYRIGDACGVFPPQADSSRAMETPAGRIVCYGFGRSLILAAESPSQRLKIEAVRGGGIALVDLRGSDTNSWFVAIATLSAGTTKGALEWLVTPSVLPGWIEKPTLQFSQAGYAPNRPKVALVELDRHDSARPGFALYRLDGNSQEKVCEGPGSEWGDYYRGHYLSFDFSEVTTPGLYQLSYGEVRGEPFVIEPDVYKKSVWQTTVGTFMPVQMCHARVVEGNRVWHGECHLDDAIMAPVDHNHFDGYAQGPSTYCIYKPGEHVPGLDKGGWHDAGDFDLRVESQAMTVYLLALAYEKFHPQMDDTAIDEEKRLVLLHTPDGKNDILQQIEHGLLTIVGGYRSMGRLYRGIQDADLAQYAAIADARSLTDNKIFHDDDALSVFHAIEKASATGQNTDFATLSLPPYGCEGAADDRWVFTEDNPSRELLVAGTLAACSRVLRGYDDDLAAECLQIAKELWERAKAPATSADRLCPALELYLATGDKTFAEAIPLTEKDAENQMIFTGWLGARSLAVVEDPAYRESMLAALGKLADEFDRVSAVNPYGLPDGPALQPDGQPYVWGISWEVMMQGFAGYYLHEALPARFPAERVFGALDYLLGRHPGTNNASLVSGVGAKSVTEAYGMNRADRSYIPGGIISGPSFIKPDYIELLEWPYLWQQTEYCMGEPTSAYVFLVMAADSLSGGTQAK
jgi:hypothetical protein